MVMMYWVIFLVFFVLAVLCGLLWSSAQRKKAVQDAYDRIRNQVARDRDNNAAECERKKSRSAAASAGGETPARPVVLVGTFDNNRALKRASEALAAAAFSGNDFVCFYGDRARSVPSVSYRMKAVWKGPPSANMGLAAQMNQQIAPCIHELFRSGRPIVLVRSASRLLKACEIIEAAGGRIGCNCE